MATAQAIPVARRRWWIAGAAAAALLAVAAAVAGRYSAPASEPAPLMRLALPPPTDHSFTPNDFAISPDGRRVAFVAASADGVSTLWVKALESTQPIEIHGSEGASWPFWSPDGRWIAFFMRGQLLKVEHNGMGLQPICPVGGTANGGAWGRDGSILFSNEVVGPLFRVHADGGTAAPVTKLGNPGEAHRFPQWLPDGKRFLYVATWTTEARRGLYLGDMDGGAERPVSPKVRSSIILNGDRLLYVDRGILYAHPIDADRGRLTGEPRAVLRNEVVADWRFGEVPLRASDNGTLVYQSPNRSELVWYDRKGKELGPVGRRGYSNPMLSPDGTRVAVTYDQSGTGEAALWVHDLERNVPSLFSPATITTAHAWSDDGWIAYSLLGEKHQIRRRAADGSPREETLVESPGHLLVNSYSRDGRHVLYMDFLNGPTELRDYDLETKTSVVIDIGAEAALSPDGQWVVYVVFRNGSLVLKRLGTEEQIVVAARGSQVRWRDDMREIYYVAMDKKLMAVPLIRSGDRLVPGTAYELFQTRIVQPRLVLFQYDVTRDGQKFLVNSLPREDAAVPLTVLLNWQRAIGR